jgi:hypothetical protein
MSLHDTFPDKQLEDDPESVRTKRKINAVDETCPISTFRLIFILLALSVCVYCAFVYPDGLLIIMVMSACCCSRNPILALPLFLAIGLYAASHLRTINQALTISEDIEAFNKKYQ